MSYIPVTVQKMDPDTEEWIDLLQLHATKVNKTGSTENFNAGRERYSPRLTFEFRWCRALEALRYATENHRLMYQGHSFNIVDYDDYMEQHLAVKLVGVAYG